MLNKQTANMLHGLMRCSAALIAAGLLQVRGARGAATNEGRDYGATWGAPRQKTVHHSDVQRDLLRCKFGAKAEDHDDACPLPHIKPPRALQSLAAPGRPSMPTHAFMITTPQAHASGRLQYALEQVRAAGLPEPRVVYGLSIDDEAVGCAITNDGVGCRLGLTVTQAMLWKTIVQENITAAWVLEDDVLFHDDFAELWPSYWTQVPPDYELVYASAWSQQTHRAYWDGGVSHTPDQLVGMDEKVWAAGAYIMSNTGARRAYSTLASMLWAHMHGNSVLSGGSSTADDFLAHVMRPSALRPGTWAIFHNTRTIPGKFKGVHITPMLSVERYVRGVGNCSCDSIDTTPAAADMHAASCPRDYVPIVSNGLVFFHHRCMNMSKFEAWMARYNSAAGSEATSVA